MSPEPANRIRIEDKKEAPTPTVPRSRRSPLLQLVVARRRTILIFGVLVLTALVVWWTTHRPTPVTYLTAAVTRGPVTRTVVATGTVNPQLTIIVGSYVSGVISNVYCDYNTPGKSRPAVRQD